MPVAAARAGWQRRPAFARFAAALEATGRPWAAGLGPVAVPGDATPGAGKVEAQSDEGRPRARRLALAGLAGAAAVALALVGLLPGDQQASIQGPAALARDADPLQPDDALAAGPLLAAFRLAVPALVGGETSAPARAGSLDAALPLAGSAQAAVRGAPQPLHFGGGGPRLTSGSKLVNLAGITLRAVARPAAEDSNPLYELGYRLQRKGEVASAIDAYRLAAENDPQHAATFYNWGYLLQQQGDAAGARAKYREALRLAPRHAFAHYNLGWLLQQAGDEAAAIEHYHAAIAANPNFAWSHYNLGWLEQRRGHDRDALADYRRSLKLDPRLALAQQNISAILRHQR
jgi:tetratricopeptide (TPR) repeat protein